MPAFLIKPKKMSRVDWLGAWETLKRFMSRT